MEHYNLTLENGTVIKVDKEKTFKEVVDEVYNDEKIILCKLDNRYFELSRIIKESGNIQGISCESPIGFKAYVRTLQFIFIKAVLDLYPQATITIEHSISKGLFCEIHRDKGLEDKEVAAVKDRMNEIIKSNSVIKRVKKTREEAINIFESYNMIDKVKLLSGISHDMVNLYELDGRYDYFYGEMGYSTGIIKVFDLMKYGDGVILRCPAENDITLLPPYVEQKRLSQVFYEAEKWLGIVGVGEVGSLNEKVKSGELRDLIMVSEALHEKKIAYLADNIAQNSDKRIVLIAGPSSSGKTTFANRLGVQLRVNGVIPIAISLDDYFVDRSNTPRDENGDYDFESIYAIDLKLFNEHLESLLNGEEVEIPSFNFRKGEREWVGHKLKLPKNGVVVVEGIHGLNPMLTSSIDDKNKFKIYISALTQLNLDNHNRIATTDIRKIRRIVRDYLSRGYGGEDTLKMWPSIRRGERKNIFVYQEEADAMFNSTIPYELCVLKPFAIKELEKVPEDSSVSHEAKRLIKFLSFFEEIEMDKVPENSILREFIGGSCFYKY
ncbi:MAG: nucleoside kinase [Clostridium sp.]